MCDVLPPPPQTPRGDPYLPGILPEKHVVAPVPSRRVPGWGVELDQPPVSLCTPPGVGKGS